MSLLDSQEAIGAVSELLRTRVSMRLNNMQVTVGRPEDATKTAGRKLNLFLYRIGFDGTCATRRWIRANSRRCGSCCTISSPPSTSTRKAISSVAHRLIGRGLTALQELNFLRPQRPAADEESRAAQDHVRRG